MSIGGFTGPRKLIQNLNTYIFVHLSKLEAAYFSLHK